MIETALALGIVAFALVPIIGLLPIGLQVSRTASDLTISAQIAERMKGMLDQSHYSDYIDSSGQPTNSQPLTQGYYYFDGEGQPLTGTGAGRSVYTAAILWLQPSTAAPSLSNTADNLVFTVQITNDPGHALPNTPVNLQGPQTNPTYKNLQSHTVFVPVYLANNGN